MINYLVLETGHEGIEHVYGVFDRDRAISFIGEKRAVAQRNKVAQEGLEALRSRLLSEAFAEFGEDNPEAYRRVLDDSSLLEFKSKHADELFGCDDPDFFCVVTVSEAGTECACGDLGVKPSQLMLR